MVTNTFPVKEAKPLIEIPKDVPQIGFLGGEAGKEVNDSIRKDYKDFSALQVAKYSNEIVIGSNPFYVVAVQSRLPSGVRVSSQADLERALRTGALNLRGTYEDTGLVLRSEDNPNEYLSANLMAQVKERLGKKAKMPVMTPLYGLEIVKDESSPQGLAFKLKEDAEIVYAPILNKSGNFDLKDIDEKTGLPKKTEGGNRTLYTINSGLSRLFLDYNLDVSSDNGNLTYSSDNGRVVLVSTAEGGSQDFLNGKLTELQRTRDAELAKINERYQRAEAVLRGK
mgnify:CR=1 FL=1